MLDVRRVVPQAPKGHRSQRASICHRRMRSGRSWNPSCRGEADICRCSISKVSRQLTNREPALDRNRCFCCVKLREVVTGFARIVVTTEGLRNGEGPGGCDVGVPQEDR